MNRTLNKSKQIAPEFVKNDLDLGCSSFETKRVILDLVGDFSEADFAIFSLVGDYYEKNGLP